MARSKYPIRLKVVTIITLQCILLLRMYSSTSSPVASGISTSSIATSISLVEIKFIASFPSLA